MSKIFFIFILLFSSILSDDFLYSDLDECAHTNAGIQCIGTDNRVSLEKDKLNYKPDACCRFDMVDMEFDDEGPEPEDSLHQCLQIKKSKVKEYVYYILDELPNFYVDIIKVACDDEVVYEWKEKDSSSNWISFSFCLLLLLFLYI